jgi:hypothetical protein
MWNASSLLDADVFQMLQDVRNGPASGITEPPSAATKRHIRYLRGAMSMSLLQVLEQHWAGHGSFRYWVLGQLVEEQTKSRSRAQIKHHG